MTDWTPSEEMLALARAIWNADYINICVLRAVRPLILAEAEGKMNANEDIIRYHIATKERERIAKLCEWRGGHNLAAEIRALKPEKQP